MPINKPVPGHERSFGGRLECGDSADLLRTVESETVHACITDPPYGIGYKGNAWDADLPSNEIWRQVHRVLVPGGHVVAASAARRYHHLAAQLEDAGFEIRDMLIWSFNQSVPSSKSVEGEWREEAKRNHEPWVVARKPFKGTLRDNWEEHRAGAVHVGRAGEPGWIGNVAGVRKPLGAERNVGVETLEVLIDEGAIPAYEGLTDEQRAKLMKKSHPTLKPLQLMRRICRMYCAHGEMVLDPFMGSGTTGMAAVADGYGFIGFEMDPDHYELAGARIMHAVDHPGSVPMAM